MVRGVVVAALATLVLAGSPSAVAQPPAPPVPIIPLPVQPANVGDLKRDAVAYYDSGAYLTNLQQAAAPAVAWINEQAPRVARPAIVLDIDETSLSNWEVIKANDFGRVYNGPCDDLPHGPCGLQAFGRLAQSTVIPPTMAVFTTAKLRGAAVFFITGRQESWRAATEQNLQAVGYTGYERLIMEPAGSLYVSAADFKAPQRAQIEAQGYTIIANVGDQPSDLAGGHAQQTYLLPNPFYRIP
ncbi:acid phosphatase [Mycobacterium gallinarum]|uniref:Acid phosphatase n=1 Tax=Mycobacterium gallinarum TaxID=39689 RepID=A0A9W4FG02_9MYCO|nr:HAD family acid phosphatase [Mycobacterium gallinarum]BBY93504.1 acid phosphatase [Mycobacterium gallinarum]